MTRLLGNRGPFLSDTDLELLKAKDEWVAAAQPEPDGFAEHRKVAASLRLQAAAAEARVEVLVENIAAARELADLLESESPPSLESVRELGVRLFSGGSL